MLLSAFILGLVGSLHCAGMCGPVALALPVVHASRGSFILGRLLYNLGRLATYALIGLLFGMLGQTLAFAGFQRWLSLAAGALILVGLIFARTSLYTPAARLVLQIKRTFSTLLQERSYPALFALGAANGFLPCGLVYIAAAAAAASGHILSSAEYMVLFGLGTLPVMLAIPLLGRNPTLRFQFQKLVPVSVALVAVLLILRGLSLGIPYISPDLSVSTGSSCH